MPVKYTTILLMILVALMVVITGSIDTTAGNSHYIGFNASVTNLLNIHPTGGSGGQMLAYGLPLNNVFIALTANAESPGFSALYISRARGQLYQNENRNSIHEFIAENPGYTMSDIARLLAMNIGTVRYHLMILSVNHLVVEYQDGIRLVRYFTNNGSYSEDQMKVVSLLRREPMGRLIDALAGNTGMSNSMISAASGLSYSEVNRYLKELVSGGVVIKDQLSMRKSKYRMAPGFESYVSDRIL